MATWYRPKTDWTGDDFVTINAISNLTNSLVYLREALNMTTPLVIESMRAIGYSDFLTARQFTAYEDALSELIGRAGSGGFGLRIDFTAKTYRDNGAAVDYARLNEIGNALISVYNVVSGTHILPSGYQEVAYIQSTGFQYIDTGIAPDNETSMQLSMYTTSVSNFYCAGAMDDYGKVIFAQDGANGGSVSATVNSVRTTATGLNRTTNGKRYDVVLSTDTNGYYSYDVQEEGGGSYSTVKLYGSIEGATAPICVFALNDRALLGGISRLYSFIIRKGGDLVCHLIPCRIIATGEVGVYDLVAKSFVGNAGTGTFVAGADV